MAETTASFGFHLKFRTNLRSHIAWFEFLRGPKFPRERKEKYESKSLQTLRKIARQVVESEIYSIGRSTGKIMESVSTIASSESLDAGVTVYFDPTISPAKGTFNSPADPSWSYAAFFERPEFNSFVLGVGLDIYNPKKYRPFHQPMEDAIAQEAKTQSMRSLFAAIRAKKPKTKGIQ